MKREPQPNGADTSDGLGGPAPSGLRNLARNSWRRLGDWVRTNTFAPPWLPARLRHPAFGYLAAVVLEVLAVVLTLLARAAIPSLGVVGMLSIVGVVLVALTWGGGPSLVATLVGALLLEYALLPPGFAWTAVEVSRVARVGLILVVGFLVSLVAGQVARGRRQANLARQEAEAQAAQLRTIFETLVDSVSVYNQEARLIQQNSAARTLLGQEQARADTPWPLAEQVAQMAPRDARGQPLSVEQTMTSRALRGEVFTGEAAQDVWVRAPDGREVFLSVTGAPIRNRQGEITGAVLLGRDITERRRLEQRTQKALDALIQLAHALVLAQTKEATLPDLLARRLAAFTIQALGEERVILVSWDEETGQLHPLVAAGLTPEQEAGWRASFGAGRRLSEWWTPEVAARLEAGKVAQVESVDAALTRLPDLLGMQRRLVAPLLTEERLVGYLALGRPESNPRFTPQEEAMLGAVAHLCALVLERERLLHEREATRAHILALREAQEQMDTFLGIAGHELKTPLTALRLGHDFMKKRLARLSHPQPGASEPWNPALTQFQEHLGRTGHQIRRMERLVDDLLDVSRIQAGKLDLRLESFDLLSLVRQVIEEQQEADPPRAIRLRAPVGQDVPILADAGRIGQVMTNYLTNALKYSSADQPVEVGVETSGRLCRVWVRDWGPGIAYAEQMLIWERFHRVPGVEVLSGSGVGLGLGLHICRTIIERHGGQVGVESAPGEGSTFWFCLSLEAEDEAERENDRSS